MGTIGGTGLCNLQHDVAAEKAEDNGEGDEDVGGGCVVVAGHCCDYLGVW